MTSTAVKLPVLKQNRCSSLSQSPGNVTYCLHESMTTSISTLAAASAAQWLLQEILSGMCCIVRLSLEVTAEKNYVRSHSVKDSESQLGVGHTACNLSRHSLCVVTTNINMLQQGQRRPHCQVTGGTHTHLFTDSYRHRCRRHTACVCVCE